MRNFLKKCLNAFGLVKKKEELIEDILKDRRRTSEVKNEDNAFILDQLGNRMGRIGKNDKRFTYTIKRSHKKLCSMLSMEIKLNNGNIYTV